MHNCVYDMHMHARLQLEQRKREGLVISTILRLTLDWLLLKFRIGIGGRHRLPRPIRIGSENNVDAPRLNHPLSPAGNPASDQFVVPTPI
jgi:hypothetical protein